MKISKRKSLYGCIIMAIVLCIGIPVYAVNEEQEETEMEISAVSEFIDGTYISDEYIAYIESGSASDTVPAMQDYSYLAESYEYLASIQNAGLQPSSYDLRTEGLVTPVVNQASLGVCWAISASEAITSSIIEQFPQESISSLPIAYFTYTAEEIIEFLWGEYDPYMSGGNDSYSIATLASWKGAILNSTYFSDYVTGAEVPKEYCYAADYHLQDAYYLQSAFYYDVDDVLSGNVEIMQSLIMQGLPITVGFAAYGEGSCYNEETYAYYNTKWDYSDHGVLIIGWDDDYSKENFGEVQPDNNGAWLIQNSWGTSWGDEGCFWISYEDPTLYVGAVYVLEEADNYANLYEYDGIGWIYSVATSTEDTKTATAANIFTAESDEQLEAVSFYTTDTNVKYTISVYTDLKNATDPTSGTRQLIEQTGTEAYAGYHTIELSDTIALEAGEQFSIVVTFENSTYDAPVPIELYILNEGETEPTYMGNGGESYVLIGEEWEDIVGVSDAFSEEFGVELYITNVCIKAFTNPLPDSDAAVSTVVFSEMEGPIADETTITLEADKGETIYYSVNGGDAVKGSTFTVDFSGTVTEYEIAVYAEDEEGNAGNTRTKTYTQASAQLVNLAVDSGVTSTYLDTADYETQSVTVSSSEDSTRIMAQSSDTITIYNVTDDNTKTEIDWTSDGLWSEEIAISEGKTILLEVVVNGTGKTSTTYTIEITGGAIEVNWTAETITYDNTQYKVTDENGNEIESGGSIMNLINITDVTVLTVTNRTSGETFTEELPTRSDLSSAVAIDYTYETTVSAFSDVCYYSFSADMSDAIQCIYGESIALTPGQDIYIQRYAVEGISFASAIVYIDVPERPEAPVIEIAERTTSTIIVEGIEGAIYRIDGGDWQYETEFTGLEEGTTYEVEAVLLATDSAFASEVGSLKVATLSSDDGLGDDVLDDDEEDLDDDTIDVTTTSTSATGNEESDIVEDGVVDTGDNALVLLWIVLIFVSLLGIGVGRRFNKQS